MFDLTRRTFLFRCEDCQMIVSIDLQEEKDLKDVIDNKFILECPCQGKCQVLRD